MDKENSRWEKIYTIVFQIPEGKVATYGQIAILAGLPGQARQVGYALHANPYGNRLPWHRVINAQGRISLPPYDDSGNEQLERLENEGIFADRRGNISLKTYQWNPEI